MLRRLRKALLGDVATSEQVEDVRKEVRDVKQSVEGMTDDSEREKKEAERFARTLNSRLDRLETAVNAIKPGTSGLRRINGG